MSGPVCFHRSCFHRSRFYRVGDVPARLVVLVSGAGTLLQALIDACGDPAYGVQIVAVGSDRDGVAGLERARTADIPTFVQPLAPGTSRADWDRALTGQVAAYSPDLVASAGFMKLVGPEFLAAYGGRTINTHPALLPSFPGMHGPRDALAYGVKVTGATVFLVDAGVDTGVILDQTAVPVAPDDTPQTLHERIKVAERDLLVSTTHALATTAWQVVDRKVQWMSEPTQTTPEPTSESDRRPIRRALVSVYDKTRLAEIAEALAGAGVEIVSTGSTARTIAAAGLPVTQVEEVTGFAECLDGRVKTLHPKVHAGLLADLRLETHRNQLDDLGIAPFQLLISNLYPFTETVASGASPEECIEQIDIGGPAMVRASAKNHANTAVLTSPGQYDELLAALVDGGFSLAQRRRLATAAFVHTATYDVAVASWLGSAVVDTSDGSGFPAWVGTTGQRSTGLRYGENPHQGAALYRSGDRAGLAGAEQLHGKEMSYNNYVDSEAARRAAYDFDEPAVAIIKHANPCGIALGADIAEAHRKAHACDPVSAFGGVVSANRPVSVEMAHQVSEVFTEVILAPAYEAGAVEILAAKKNLRILVVEPGVRGGTETRTIDGGLLVQERDTVDHDHDRATNWQLVTGRPAAPEILADLEFAWQACRAVKSNAILLAHDRASVGVGMGQVNRVDSSRLAVDRAGVRAAGAVAASDAFFPFADGAEILLAAGVAAIVEPGGSKRDDEVVAACARAGAALYFTGARHFYH